MAKISGGELLVRCLLKEDVKYVFGIPGGQLTTFLDAIYRTDGIEFIMTRHEEAAAHMADAYARLTNKVGVCCGTVGPGAANLVSGVATAFADSIPMLVITPQVQSWLAYPHHGSQQELDQLNLFKPITKWSVTINHYKRIPELIQRAFRIATSSRPGPVHVEIAVDVFFEAHDEGETSALLLEPSYYRAVNSPIANPKLIEEASDMLINAKYPLIHAGGGVLRSNATDELLQLAEYLAAPISTSLSARDAISQEHPLSLHPLAMSTAQAKSEADVVLAIGCQFGQLEFFGRPPVWGNIKTQKVIQIDIDPEMIGYNRAVTIAIVSDAKQSLNQLLEVIKKKISPRKIESNQKLKIYKEQEKQFIKELENQAESNQIPIHPLRVIKDVREFFPKNAIIVVDGGNTAVWANYLCKVYEPNTFLCSAGMGQLGVGLPYALSAKLVYPDRQVFILHGDGSFMLMNQELETARRYNLQIIDVINNDKSWGMIKSGQAATFDKRYIGVDFYDVRYDKMAEAMGCYGERVEKPEDIIPALKRAVDSKLPAVVDVLISNPVDYPPPHLQMLVSLWLEGCQLPPYE